MKNIHSRNGGNQRINIDRRYHQILQSKYSQNINNINNTNNTKQEVTDRGNKKKKWMKSKSRSFRLENKENNRNNVNNINNKTKEVNLERGHRENRGNRRNRGNMAILLTQHNISLIISNWYKIYGKIVINPFIISALMSYSIERFEFDEKHRSILTWIDYNVGSVDDDSSIDNNHYYQENNNKEKDIISKSKSITNIELIKLSITSSNDDYDICNSEDSITSNSTSTDLSGHPPLLLSPSVSNTSSSSSNTSLSNVSSFECSASLDKVKWSTIFFGTILNKLLLSKNIYVCNLNIERIGYGFGISFWGYNGNRNYNNKFYHKNKLNETLSSLNGYPDKINDVFTLYDDGEFYDWNNDKSNVNNLPNNTYKQVKLISKLSKYKLKTAKSKQSNLVSSPLLSVPNNSESISLNSGKKKKTNNFYNKGRSKKRNVQTYKKINDKFTFDKDDIIQIVIDLYHSKITIHNINNHKCVVIKDFNYNSIRIGFVLRYSTINIIDQKWL